MLSYLLLDASNPAWPLIVTLELVLGGTWMVSTAMVVSQALRAMRGGR